MKKGKRKKISKQRMAQTKKMWIAKNRQQLITTEVQD